MACGQSAARTTLREWSGRMDEDLGIRRAGMPRAAVCLATAARRSFPASPPRYRRTRPGTASASPETSSTGSPSGMASGRATAAMPGRCSMR